MKPSKESNKKTYIIGLTGGIATGKSTAAQALRSFGADVIDADAISRGATMPGGSKSATPMLTRIPKATPMRVIATLPRPERLNVRKMSLPIERPVTWKSELIVDIAAESIVRLKK